MQENKISKKQKQKNDKHWIIMKKQNKYNYYKRIWEELNNSGKIKNLPSLPPEEINIACFI